MWVGYRYVLPVYATNAVKRALAKRGVPDATFRIDELSLDELRLEDVSADSVGLRARAIEVRYTPWDLIARRVRSVTVTGAHWRVGELPEALRACMQWTSAARGQRPVDEIYIDDSVISVDRNGVRGDVHIDADVHLLGNGRAAFVARVKADDVVAGDATAHGATLDARGEIDRWRIATLSATGAIARLVASDRELTDVELWADHNRGDIAVGASAHTGGWSINELGTSVPDEAVVWPALRRLPVSWNAVTSGTRGASVALSGNGNVLWGESAPSLEIEDSHVRARARRTRLSPSVALAGASADIRVTGTVSFEHSELALRGSARARQLHAGPLTLTRARMPVKATARGRRGNVRLRGRGTLSAAGTDASATIRTKLAVGANKRPRGHVSVSVPRTSVHADDDLGRTLHQLVGVALDGFVAIEADIPIGRGAHARTDIEIDSASAAAGKLRVNDVRASLSLSGARPHGRQRIEWTAARFGKTRLGAGSLAARVLDDRRIALDRAELAVAGGTLTAKPVVLDTQHVDTPVALRARGLRLADVLDATTHGNATGRGTLDGRFALHLRGGPTPRLLIGDGVLRSRSAGRIHVHNAPGMSASLGSGTLLRRRIAATLADFAFSRLSLTSRRQVEGAQFRLQLEGKGVRVPQELGLTVNIRGAQQVLDRVIDLCLSIHVRSMPPRRTNT